MSKPIDTRVNLGAGYVLIIEHEHDTAIRSVRVNFYAEYWEQGKFPMYVARVDDVNELMSMMEERHGKWIEEDWWFSRTAFQNLISYFSRARQSDLSKLAYAFQEDRNGEEWSPFMLEIGITSDVLMVLVETYLFLVKPGENKYTRQQIAKAVGKSKPELAEIADTLKEWMK